ncbi:hypothetical protein [Teichococcus oryzae]|uniref:Uncharacterized protein n=1 Tax=Teichococcus oryzae TaxID=1608942 RepID=A0A5B2TAY1_9PROT|nr:hypothetical protein [Pseudoroseomonas oryzae]KAA2211672.1 hypothetical protein F0Q34_19005 [Pseudoroseomonas oryzae]
MMSSIWRIAAQLRDCLAPPPHVNLAIVSRQERIDQLCLEAKALAEAAQQRATKGLLATAVEGFRDAAGMYGMAEDLAEGAGLFAQADEYAYRRRANSAMSDVMRRKLRALRRAGEVPA